MRAQKPQNTKEPVITTGSFHLKPYISFHGSGFLKIRILLPSGRLH